MKRKNSEASADLAEPARPAAAGDAETGTQQDTEDRGVGRRALLTRGGVVVAGIVGAGVAGTAVAGTAHAATGDAVLQGNINNVGTDTHATVIEADNAATTNSATPTMILTNTGTDALTGKQASPTLRLTPAASGLDIPANATSGGDMVVTNDGNLWFSHAIPNGPVIPAPVHTDANSDSYVPLSAPVRMLDTRTSAGRANVLDPAGKFDSSGRLLAGQTIHLDLDLLVHLGYAVTANLTVTGSTDHGYVTIWSGAVALPNASSINFAAGQTVANLTVSGLAELTVGTTTYTDTVAIYASRTTHVILDVGAFTVADFAQVNPSYLPVTMTGPARAERLRQVLAKRQAFKQ